MYPWEDVSSTCPHCGKDCGTIFNGERKQYRVPAHGRMGNKSYNEDPVAGMFCDACGLEIAVAKEDDGTLAVFDVRGLPAMLPMRIRAKSFIEAVRKSLESLEG